MEKEVQLPLREEDIADLTAGEQVLLSGPVYVARDAAHKRMQACLDAGEKLPFPIAGATLYYMGPSPAREGRPIGAAGPTTAGRMDVYTPALLRQGLKGMIGKGNRSAEVCDAMRQQGAVYFAAIGGAGALLSQKIISSEVLAYEDLGPEAIRLLQVEKFPVIVAIDAAGHNIYERAEMPPA